MVSAAVAALNTVRCNGYGCFGLYVHWVQNAATAISMAGPGPSSSSDTRLAAYDTDNVDPFDDRQRQRHLPRGREAREHRQAGEQQGIGQLAREEQDQRGAAGQDRARDVNPREERQIAPARWRAARGSGSTAIGSAWCHAAPRKRSSAMGSPEGGWPEHGSQAESPAPEPHTTVLPQTTCFPTQQCFPIRRWRRWRPRAERWRRRQSMRSPDNLRRHTRYPTRCSAMCRHPTGSRCTQRRGTLSARDATRRPCESPTRCFARWPSRQPPRHVGGPGVHPRHDAAAPNQLVAPHQLRPPACAGGIVGD